MYTLQGTRRPSVDAAVARFAQDLDPIESPSSVTQKFQAFIEGFGFSSASCTTIPVAGSLSRDCVLMSTRPPEWTADYLRRDYLKTDPVARRVLHDRRAFAWSAAGSHDHWSSRERAVMQRRADLDMREGFVVPVFESTGNTGVVSMAGSKPRLDVAARGALTLASVYIYNKLHSLRRRGEHADGIGLTGREIEVLQWLATGKSDWEIGTILGISGRTVNYHAENIRRKLGVGTRMQAVVAALERGKLRR
jgi:LuxR family quorum sensing-dependent transcriptional regulator